jgi:hypothetical protein
MKRIIIFILSLVFIGSCQKSGSKNQLSLFVGFWPICNEYRILFHINDSLVFDEKILDSVIIGSKRWVLMSKVNKTDSIIKFKIQINESDTSFFIM